jgi:ankyrin repeat protein
MDTTSLALKRACSEGNLSEVQRLIEAGADVNGTDQYGSGTLLTFHPEIIEYLLSRGADPDTQTNENGVSVLAGLAFVNQIECVRVLLRHGANPNRGRDESGETPLHHGLIGSERDRSSLVKLLLDHGANPNAKTVPGMTSYNFWGGVRTRGETPLHRAAAYSSEDTIKFLLAAGADRTMRDANGDSPVVWAGWHLRAKEIVDLLR